jgi:hypothetical protein
MLTLASCIIVTVLLLSAPATAQNRASEALPQFQVEPFWPKPLPNNWILGQVAGIATDRNDRIWLVHRPTSLTTRERAAEQNPRKRNAAWRRRRCSRSMPRAT